MMSKKVLIVDDDPTNIFALSAVLRGKGWPVVTASSATEGINLLKTDNGIGIVLLDMMMPEIDGYEMIQLVRKESGLQHLPVIAVTAQAMVGDREKCLEAGADEYVSKPIDTDRLLEILHHNLNQV